jgi:hypothetical protein
VENKHPVPKLAKASFLPFDLTVAFINQPGQ